MNFLRGDVEKVLPELIETRKVSADVAFVDPPRKGCDKVALDTLLKVLPNRIVYVSCNPATQARDLALLNISYEVTKVQPVDMFPHTHHIENVVKLEKKP